MKTFGITAGFLFSGLLLALPHRVNADGVLIAITNTGAQVPVDISSTRVWNFEIKEAISVDFTRALFGLNEGSQTTQPITFTLYDGLGGSGTILAQLSLNPSQVDNSFTTMEQFDFADVPIVKPGYYSVTLTSAAPSGGSTQYMLKSSSLALYVDDGSASPTLSSTTQLSSNYWAQDTNADGSATTTFTANTTQAQGIQVVPEPSSMALAGTAAVTLGVLGIRRRRK